MRTITISALFVLALGSWSDANAQGIIRGGPSAQPRISTHHKPMMRHHVGRTFNPHFVRRHADRPDFRYGHRQEFRHGHRNARLHGAGYYPYWMPFSSDTNVVAVRPQAETSPPTGSGLMSPAMPDLMSIAAAYALMGGGAAASGAGDDQAPKPQSPQYEASRPAAKIIRIGR